MTMARSNGLFSIALLLSNLLQIEAWSNLFKRRQQYDYDLVIIGAGASGLFASGAAQLMGLKTALIEQANHVVGGDCTNAACVPSKAVRSMARQAVASSNNNSNTATTTWLGRARQHASETVQAVRKREDPAAIATRLDLLFVRDVHFLDPHTLAVQQNQTAVYNNITTKYVLIATGASPIVPNEWQEQAKTANVPIYTYRSLLSPEGDTSSFWNTTSSSPSLLVVGGGATACELSQSMARLGCSTTLVAPGILPHEPISLQNAAIQLLQQQHSNVQLHLGQRMQAILPNGQIQLDNDDNNTILPRFDAILVCIGRSPTESLVSLQLDNAGIKLNDQSSSRRLLVNPSLQSISAKHVYACGDCVIQGRDRTAAQAAWTGFHAVRNLCVPWILRVGGNRRSIHPTVPRVIYTDPELASVGLTYEQCIQRYGMDTVHRVCVPEVGSDRADMEEKERDASANFVELCAHARSGRVLGCTACGPAASELANSMGMAITNRLTVRDVARSVHSYPSYGYLLHRIALSMALNDVWGLLEACGPVGGIFARLGRSVIGLLFKLRMLLRLPHQRRRMARQRQWEAQGVSQYLYIKTDSNKIGVISYYDVYSNATLRGDIEANTEALERPTSVLLTSRKEAQDCLAWLKRMP